MNKLMKRTCKAMLLCAGLVGLVGCQPEDTRTTVIWWNNYQVPADGMSEEEARKDSDYTEYFFTKDLIEKFEAEHTDIHIETVYHGAYGTIAEDLKQALNSPNLPNIASGYPDNVAIYNGAGVTLDMSQYVDSETIGFGKKTVNGETVDDPTTVASDLNQNYFNAEKGMYANNHYLSLPYSKSSETLVVNQTVFDQVGAGASGTSSSSETGYQAPIAKASKTKYEIPQNWTELIQTARKMKADYPEVFADNNPKDGKDANVDSQGFFNAVPFCWDSAENMIISLLQNMDIPYTDANGNSNATKILFNNTEAKKLVAQLKKWNNEGLIATQDQLYISDPTKGYHQYSSTMVAQGDCFMCVSSTAGSRYFSADGFYVSFNHTPNIDETIYQVDADQDIEATSEAKDAKVISQGPSLTFFKKSENGQDPSELASWEFYKFLTNAENSANLAVATSYFPIRTSSYDNEKVKALTGAKAVTADSTTAEKNSYYSGSVLKLNQTYTANNNYFLSPVFDMSAAARTAIGDLIEEVFNATATTDEEINAAVETAFTNAINKVVTSSSN